MSDITPALPVTTGVEQEEFVPLPLSEHTYFNLGGSYCFVGNVPDIKKHTDALMASMGVPVYFILGTMKDVFKVGQVTHTNYSPRLFKIVDNLVGHSITEVQTDPGLEEFKPDAWFKLPKIPFMLVQRMDVFFRNVAKKLGTESILLLTYDPAVGGSEGWGVLSPTQSNTAGNCDYEADSVAGDYPESAFIVGSAHSHPNMSAFASGTDHKDQDENDGLHITYGWQSGKNNGATEYHIELQIGNTAFKLTPAQVFDDIPTLVPDDEIEKWMESVSKKGFTGTRPTATNGTTQGTYSGGSSGSGFQNVGYGGASYAPGAVKKPNLPTGCPSPQTNTLIAELSPPVNGTHTCPWCDTILVDLEVLKRRCLSCHLYICMPNETLNDVFEARRASNSFPYDLDVKTNPSADIYIWRREGSDDYLEHAYAVEDLAKKAKGGAASADSSLTPSIVDDVSNFIPFDHTENTSSHQELIEDFVQAYDGLECPICHTSIDSNTVVINSKGMFECWMCYYQYGRSGIVSSDSTEDKVVEFNYIEVEIDGDIEGGVELGEIVFDCDSCAETKIRFGDLACYSCGTVYPFSHWREIAVSIGCDYDVAGEVISIGGEMYDTLDLTNPNKVFPVEDQETDLDGTVDTRDPMFYVTICCESPEELCDCGPNQIIFNEIYDIPDKDYANLYFSPEVANTFASDTGCESCGKYYTPSCMPLRSWIKNYMFNPKAEEIGQIDSCNQYVHWMDDEQHVHLTS